jgi:hypothetical protein
MLNPAQQMLDIDMIGLLGHASSRASCVRKKKKRYIIGIHSHTTPPFLSLAL